MATKMSEAVRSAREGGGLVNWGAILSGAAVAVAVLYVLQAFWRALGFGSDISFFANNLDWWGLISAIVAALVGGLVAGYATGGRDAVAGVVSGLTVWGLVLIAASSLGLSAAVQIVVGASEGASELGIEDPQWASFVSVFGGLVVTAIGGVIGGRVSPRSTHEEP